MRFHVVVTTAVLVVAAIVSGQAEAQDTVPSCRKYEDVLYAQDGGDGSPSFCAGLIDYEYYVKDSRVSQIVLDQMAWTNTKKNSTVVETLLSILPSSCSLALKTAACLTTFPRCELVDPYFVNLTIPQIGFFTQAECLANGMTYTTGGCFKPIPKLPCRKETCFGPAVSSKPEKEICPLVSGNFAPLLRSLSVSPDTEPLLKQEAANMTASIGCDTTPMDASCQTKRVTMNLLTALGFSPDCGEKKSGLDVFPNGNQPSFAAIISARIGTRVDCGKGPTGANLLCADLRKAYECGSVPTKAKQARLQRGYDIVPEDSVCGPFVNDRVNQDTLINHQLATLYASVQTPPNDGICQAYLKKDLLRGLYYVPTYPGQTPLGVRLNGDQEQSLANWNSEKCPINIDPKPQYSNFEKTPLCTKYGAAYNARDCYLSEVNAAVKAFPPYASYQCRAAYLEMVCTKAHMKLEQKSICLVDSCSSDAATASQEDRRAFYFSLPRFPSQAVCQTFQEKCAYEISQSESLQKIKCNAVISSQCGNSQLSTWGCKNPLEGKPAFPESKQEFLDGSALPAAVAAVFVKAGALTAFSTSVVEPTVTAPFYTDSEPTTEDLNDLKTEFCSCPYPLVVPDDPLAETLNPGVCCALPCRGSMHTEQDMKTFASIQLWLCALGVVCAFLMVLTWGFFKEKEKQYMTFWFSFSSFNVSLGFFVLSLSSNGSLDNSLCIDNSQYHSLRDGFSVCVFQATWLVFFGSSAVSWWTVQSTDLFRKLVLGKRNTDETKLKYHLFAWTFPTITTAVLLGTRSLGYRDPTPYCLIAKNVGSWVEWVSFYAYVAVCFLAGTIMMFSVLAVIYGHTTKAQANQTSSGSKFRARYRLYRIPMLFVFLFIFVWLNIFSFRLLVAANEGDYEKQGKGWALCLLENFKAGIINPAFNASIDTSRLVNPPEGTVGCGETQGGIPQGSLMTTFVVVMAQSLLIFFVFGIQYDNVLLWMERFGCADPNNRSRKDITENTLSKEDSKGMVNTTQLQMGSYYGSSAQSSYAPASPSSFFSSIQAPKGPAPMPPPSPGSYY